MLISLREDTTDTADNMNDYYGHLRLIWLVIKYKKGFEVKVTSNPFLFIQFFN